jgi:hypothetical protein
MRAALILAALVGINATPFELTKARRRPRSCSR